MSTEPWYIFFLMSNIYIIGTGWVAFGLIYSYLINIFSQIITLVDILFKKKNMVLYYNTVAVCSSNHDHIPCQW